MSFSVHTRSVNWSFNPSSPSYAKKKSFSNNIYRHVDRDENDSDKVKKATKSNINVNLTKYNVHFIKDSEIRKDKAQQLINERIEARKIGGIEFTKEDADRLDLLTTKKHKSAQRAYKRALKSRDEGRADDNWVQMKLDARTAIEDEMDELRKKREDSRKSYKYNQWDPRIGVGGISTLQLSKTTLEKMGWQMKRERKTIKTGKNRGKKRYEKTAIPIDEQMEYEKNHPEVHVIKDVTEMYTTMFKAVQDNPDKFGTLVSASLHYDEEIPHLDYLTLDIGVDLEGNPVGHVGEKDNHTNNDILNVRHRTYINGTNDKGTLATDFRNSDWGAHLQDVLDDSIKQHLTQNQKNHVDDWQLSRGLTKQQHNDRRAEAMKTLGLDEDDLVDLAEYKKTVNKQLNSSAEASTSSANVVINSITSNAFKTADSYATSIDASLSARNDELNSISDEMKASSEAMKASSNAMLASSVAMKASSNAMKASSSDMRSASIANSNMSSTVDSNISSANLDLNGKVDNIEKEKQKLKQLRTRIYEQAKNNQKLSDFFGDELQKMSKNNPYTDKELNNLKSGGKDKNGKNIVQLIFDKLIQYAENGLNKHIKKFLDRLKENSKTYDETEQRNNIKRQNRIKENEKDGPDLE